MSVKRRFFPRFEPSTAGNRDAGFVAAAVCGGRFFLPSVVADLKMGHYKSLKSKRRRVPSRV